MNDSGKDEIKYVKYMIQKVRALSSNKNADITTGYCSNIAQADLSRLALLVHNHSILRLIEPLYHASLAIAGVMSRNAVIKELSNSLIDWQVSQPNKLGRMPREELRGFTSYAKKIMYRLKYEYTNGEVYIVTDYDDDYRHVTMTDVNHVFNYMLNGLKERLHVLKDEN